MSKCAFGVMQKWLRRKYVQIVRSGFFGCEYEMYFKKLETLSSDKFLKHHKDFESLFIMPWLAIKVWVNLSETP